jgi:hypothetical protein
MVTISAAADWEGYGTPTRYCKPTHTIHVHYTMYLGDNAKHGNNYKKDKFRTESQSEMFILNFTLYMLESLGIVCTVINAQKEFFCIWKPLKF